MIKKKLSLQQVIDLIKPIESLINEKIDNYKQGKKSSPDLISYVILLQHQLSLLKLAKDSGNSKRHGLFGKTNSYWIYELSNLKRRKELYSSKNQKDSNENTRLDEQITNIEKKLSFFNSTKKIRVYFYPEIVKQFL